MEATGPGIGLARESSVPIKLGISSSRGHMSVVAILTTKIDEIRSNATATVNKLPSVGGQWEVKG